MRNGASTTAGNDTLLEALETTLDSFEYATFQEHYDQYLRSLSRLIAGSAWTGKPEFNTQPLPFLL